MDRDSSGRGSTGPQTKGTPGEEEEEEEEIREIQHTFPSCLSSDPGK